jgi:DNA invertase Pin-like site-specific DNA recombinase
VRRCREEIARRGWQETAVLSDSEIPGTVTQRRSGYQQLLASAKARKFDVVVADELGRLSRDDEERAGLRKRLKFWGLQLRTLDGIDTVASPESAGPMMLVKGLVNEAEIEANAHRSRRGLEGRVLAGHHAGGAPYGYRTRAVHADKPGDPAGTGRVIGYEYLIHEAEAEVIVRIFQLYADGMSTRQIASLLNAEGVLPPGARWKDRQGVRRTWSHGAIHGDPTRGMGILNQEKYIGRLVWNRSTWPRDPDRDAKQVRRELPVGKWVVREVPELRIVPQELWDAAKARQRQRSARARQVVTVPRQSRLLSGLLICGRCGARYVLRGRQTYCCATRQNRGSVVCDCMATVNAVEAEQAILDLLEPLFCDPRMLDRLVAQVRERLSAAQGHRARRQGSEGKLRSDLSKVEAEIGRLVDWIAKGVLVEDLEERMLAAKQRRDHLRGELAKLAAAEVPTGLEVLPSAVRKIVSDLRGMLAAGQTEKVKSALSRLVTRVEVHEDPRPGRKRPGAKLVVRGSLEALLQMTGKVESVHSPGGILTPLIFRLPPRTIRLLDRHSHSSGLEQRRLAAGGG